jgi:hypothetical protein
MAKFIEDYETLAFPKPGRVLSQYTEEDIFKKWVNIKHRLELFKYEEESNDIREGYLQFMDDLDLFLDTFRELVLDITEAMEYYKEVKEHAAGIMRVAKRQERQSKKLQDSLLEHNIDPLDPLAKFSEIEKELEQRAALLLERKENMEKAEEEIAITEQLLQEKKSEMQLALKSRYTLTEKQKAVLLDEKDMILDGVEEWGSVTGACSHNHGIKSKPATIHMYCQMFPEFGAAIEVSKQLFKDKLEALMVERAIEGTENPQFGRGEYIGDYKIKDNKMFLELMKAKMPEVYNKKTITDNKASTQVNNTMNIISFANIDETKEGYTRDVGVVLDVDDTGKVQRITQEKKMLEFYKQKEGAEIIMPDDPPPADK